VNGALIGGVLLPGLLLILTLVWPWIDRSSVTAVGVWWPRERRTANAVCLLVVAAMVVLTLVGAFMRGPGWLFYWPWQAWPDLSPAVDEVRSRFGLSVEDFLAAPKGTMAVVLSRQIILSREQKATAADQLHAAFRQYQRQQAPAKPRIRPTR